MDRYRHAAATVLAVALHLFLSGVAAAAEVRAGNLAVTSPWTRATAPGMPTAAGFLTIVNSGDAADRLIGASTSSAARVEIHRCLMTDGVMRMEPVAGGVEVPAGGVVEFAPGGLHLMLMRPREPFALGSSVPLTLEFERAGSVDVELSVEAAGASSPHGGH